MIRYGPSQQPPPQQSNDYQQDNNAYVKSFEDGTDANIRVVIRIRPLNSTESRRADGLCVKVGTDGETLQVRYLLTIHSKA